MPRLGVNVDHVATLRQARGGKNPDPVAAALVCQKAGAHAIVMHLREDRRHIQELDLFRAKEALRIKLNLEMSVAPEIIRIARRLVPTQATLVPEKRQERTTESGLDVLKNADAVRRCIDQLKEKKIEVSLFIDPDLRQLEKSKRLGADAVEFHTGTYADAPSPERTKKELKRLAVAVQAASRMGITAHAGHGLDYENVRAVAAIGGLDEFNIGYSIVTRAVWTGLESAVKEMRALVGRKKS